MQRLRTTQRHAAGPRFIDPTVLARIGNLELLARTVVEGFMSGLHRSRHLGVSLDFAEHRAYMPGDDIRRIDWRLFARTDRYHVKEFEADTNANFAVLLDASRSMRYGSRGMPKLDYARYLAACLAYFSHGQRDRVGLATFDREVIDYIPPSATRLEVVLHTIDALDREAGLAGGVDRPADVGLEAPLRQIADRLRRRGIVVLISDLYEPPESVLGAVRHLRQRGSDVIVFHVLDPAELEFPFDKAMHIRDLESGERIPVVPDVVRERYVERVRAHVAELSRRLAAERIDYTLFDTAKPLDHALFAYLSARQRLSRVR